MRGVAVQAARRALGVAWGSSCGRALLQAPLAAAALAGAPAVGSLSAGPTTPLGLTGLLPRAALPLAGRAFHASPPARDADSANELLQQVAVRDLKASLAELADDKVAVPAAEVERLVVEAGAAPDVAGAVPVLDALHKAGVVLKFKGVVYLKPEEVIANVMAALPHASGEPELSEEEAAELSALEKEVARVESAARFHSSMWMWTGFTLGLTQFGVFYWMTFYESSWDFMEPVSYFYSLFLGMCGYLYFLTKDRELSLEGFSGSVKENAKTKLYKSKGIDIARLRTLQMKLRALKAVPL